MRYIHYSERESECNLLRIGRTVTLDMFDADKLIDEIIELRLDVCKMKVNISDLDVFSKLNSLKIPYGIYSILIRQSIDLTNDIKFKKTHLDVRQYHASQKKTMFNLVERVLQQDTASYYSNMILNHLFKRKVVEQQIAEYHTYFDNKADKDKYGFIAYMDNQPVGFCTLQINGDEGEGIFVGILPEYRGGNFFQDMIHSEMMQSYLCGCKTYNCNTVLLNPRSLNTTIRQGMKITGGILNVNIFSLLNNSSDKKTQLVSNTREIIHHSLAEIKRHEYDGDKVLIPTDIQFNIRDKHSKRVSWNLTECFKSKHNIIYICFEDGGKNYGYLQFDVKY